jgi:hypothetical protein
MCVPWRAHRDELPRDFCSAGTQGVSSHRPRLWILWSFSLMFHYIFILS